MRLYTARDHLSTLGVILLFFGSIISGLLIGILAYFISQLIYLVVVFALVIGVSGMLVYARIILLTKIRQPFLLTMFGMIMGLCVVASFYGIPYLLLRNDFISNAQNEYHVDIQTASRGLDNILIRETGSGGFLGYMKLRAREGDTFTSYFIMNSVPVHEFSFTLKSTTAWIYWIVEILLFSLPGAIWGYYSGKREFNINANDWYDQPKQFGATTIDHKEELLAHFQLNDMDGINRLLIDEEQLAHPMIEMYRQFSRNKKGDLLVSIRQTSRVNPTKVKRATLSQWEVSPQEFDRLVNKK